MASRVKPTGVCVCVFFVGTPYGHLMWVYSATFLVCLYFFSIVLGCNIRLQPSVRGTAPTPPPPSCVVVVEGNPTELPQNLTRSPEPPWPAPPAEKSWRVSQGHGTNCSLAPALWGEVEPSFVVLWVFGLFCRFVGLSWVLECFVCHVVAF